MAQNVTATNNDRMNVHYAECDDVLYVAIGQPVPASCDEDDDGILWRVSYANGEIVGATIVEFLGRGNDTDRLLAKIADRLSFSLRALRQAAVGSTH